MLHTKHPRALLRLALICLAVFGVTGLPFMPDAGRWTDVNDGARGVLLGMAITLVALAGTSRRRARTRG